MIKPPTRSQLIKKKFSEKCRVLGMTYLFLHEAYPNGVVDMQNYFYSTDAACPAGWFAVACGMSLDGVSLQSDIYDIFDSTQDIMEFLGFYNHSAFNLWVENNYKIWGNPFGNTAFSSAQSYGKMSFQSVSLYEIGIHWLKVADNFDSMKGK